MKKALGVNSSAKQTKKKISVRVPIKMLEDIDAQLKTDGLSMKKRSSWICDAISQLITQENYSELVMEEWIEAGRNKPIQITLSKEAEKNLYLITENLGSQVKEPKSATIRCAAMQKLICFSTEGYVGGSESDPPTLQEGNSYVKPIL